MVNYTLHIIAVGNAVLCEITCLMIGVGLAFLSDIRRTPRVTGAIAGAKPREGVW
jgi:hypothetical protein